MHLTVLKATALCKGSCTPDLNAGELVQGASGASQDVTSSQVSNAPCISAGTKLRRNIADGCSSCPHEDNLMRLIDANENIAEPTLQ